MCIRDRWDPLYSSTVLYQGLHCQPPALIRLLDRHPNTIQRSDYSTDIRLLNRNPNTQQKPYFNAKIRYIRQKSDILIQKSDYSTGILFSYTVPLKGGVFWEKKKPLRERRHRVRCEYIPDIPDIFLIFPGIFLIYFLNIFLVHLLVLRHLAGHSKRFCSIRLVPRHLGVSK